MTDPGIAEVTLPHGLWIDGRRCRTAHLRAVTAADEVALHELDQALRPAQQATLLLGRCLCTVGDEAGPLPGDAAALVPRLVIGDREALLLHLRRLTFGDRLDCLLTCPAEDCRAPLDLTLRVSELLLPGYEAAPERHTWRLADGREVHFRLPTVADVAAVAAQAATDPDGAAATLLRRCVDDTVELPPDAAEAVSQAMADADPQAELRLALDCPACGESFSALLDAGNYLLAELSGRVRQVFREIHTLARAYGWREADLLAMTPRRRARYLELIADTATAGAPPTPALEVSR